MLLRLCPLVLCILAVTCEQAPAYYDEKTLVKLVTLEFNVELQEQQQRKWTNTMERTHAKLDGWESKMSGTKMTAEKMKAEIERNVTEMATAWDTAFKEKLASYNLTVQSYLGKAKHKSCVFRATQFYLAKHPGLILVDFRTNQNGGKRILGPVLAPKM